MVDQTSAADDTPLMPESPQCPDPIYVGAQESVKWTGAPLDRETIDFLKSGPLAERLHDILQRDALVAEMRSLATSDVANETISRLLESEPEPLDWEIGEALSETLLEQWHGAIWVWNSGRDRRTTKASLPGADLVGLCVDAGGARLLFGEVKSSSHHLHPPGVLTGRTGMIAQLERLSELPRDHWVLIKWLNARCHTATHKSLFEGAVRRYIGSRGKDLRLIGCLVRDTSPNEGDLQGRARSLASTVVDPMVAELYAWYLPDPMADWPNYVRLVSDD